MKKRGLSAIVATLIIILLTLVAVGIIWVVVRNVIQSGAEEVELGQYTLDLQIKAVQIQDGDITIVIVRRNPGEGEFVGMNFVFSDGKNSEVIRENISLRELEEKTITFTLTTLSTSSLKSVSVYPIYMASSGKETTGTVSDTFDVKKGGSIATGGATTGNFAALGFAGSEAVQYTLASGNAGTPQFQNVIIDPLDVHLGENQTFTAEVYSPSGIASVTTITQLDNQVLNLPLQKISESNGVETWSASWQVYDTHSDIYRTTFTATDNEGNQNSVNLTWTDPCTGLVHGSDSTISDPCVIGVNQIDGLDTGKITLGSSVTLTLNAGSYFVYTPGYSIAFSSNSKILKSGAIGGITKKYLFYHDSDSDLAATNSTYVASASSSLSGFTRAKDATGTSDCDATNSAVSITRTQRLDADADTYTVTGSSFCASSSTYSSSACTTAGSDYAKNSASSCLIIGTLSGTDCYDLNATAKPGQTSFFTQKRGTVNDSAGNDFNSWDYNCDASISRSPTTCSDNDGSGGTCPASTCNQGQFAASTSGTACGGTYQGTDYTSACGVGDCIESVTSCLVKCL